MITISKLKAALNPARGFLAMTCDVLWHGRRIAHARNDGCGGITMLYRDGSEEDFREAQAFAEKQPDLDLSGVQFVRDGKPGFHTLDSWVDQLANDAHELKADQSWTKRTIAKKTIIITGSEIRVLGAEFSPAIEAHVRQKYPKATIINKLSFDDAVKEVTAARRRAAAEEAAKYAAARL